MSINVYITMMFWCVGFHLNCSPRSVTKIKSYIDECVYWLSLEVIKLCDCSEDVDCGCVDRKSGFAVI
jgi:hypothetical protein